jgi:hypothetical protein
MNVIFFKCTHRVEGEFIYVRGYILPLRRLLFHFLIERITPHMNDSPIGAEGFISLFAVLQGLVS